MSLRSNISKTSASVSSGFQARETWFHCFRAFGNPMKHEARVFEITSPTKEISLNYHLNKFSQFNYYIWDVKYAWTSKNMRMMCTVLSPNCCAVTTEVTLPSCANTLLRKRVRTANSHWKSINSPLQSGPGRPRERNARRAGAIRAAASRKPARKPLNCVSLWKRLRLLPDRSGAYVLKRNVSSTWMRTSNTKACRLLFKRPSSRKRKRIWQLDLFLGTFPRLSKLTWELTASCQCAS